MKKWMSKALVCPECVNKEIPLELHAFEEKGDDVIQGTLACPGCQADYPVRDGVAIVLPKQSLGVLAETSGYNSQAMLSSYMWSHFSEYFNGAGPTEAYKVWASFFKEKSGPALDIGCSVGRLSFELSQTHTKVIGIDTSLSFIRKARQILTEQSLDGDLILEGNITEKFSCPLNASWNTGRVEFLVADALALPFAKDFFQTVTSVNVLEKVPEPMGHLREVNRVMAGRDSMFVFSDPFSWDSSVSAPDKWLGGRNSGKFKGRGMDNLIRLLSGQGKVFDPPFAVNEQGKVEWKIRKTENLWEHIWSQYLIATR